MSVEELVSGVLISWLLSIPLFPYPRERLTHKNDSSISQTGARSQFQRKKALIESDTDMLYDFITISYY